MDGRPSQGRRPRDLPLAPLQGRPLRRWLDDGCAQGREQLVGRPSAQSLRARRQDRLLAGVERAEEAAAPVAPAGRAVCKARAQSDSVMQLEAPGDAVPFLANALYDDGVALPGVTGAVPESESFADAWTAVAGGVHRVRMRQGIYRARSVALPDGISGSARPIVADDRELVVEWLQAFEREALHGHTPQSDHEQWFERRLASDTGGVDLWEDGSAVVSMCGYGGATPHGIRVGPVYTPPDRRSRGYGSAVTAHVTKAQLDGGRDYCFLYTDLTNPTSNKIYMQIGYERVCDS